MNISITEENIYTAISISWISASKANTHDAWLHRWGRIYAMLDGMWDMVNYSEWEIDEEREKIGDMLNNIKFLRDIAHENRYNF